MYNNYQQPSAYQTPSAAPYTQPTYSNQYEQPQYVDSTNMYQQQSMYQSDPNQSSVYSVPVQQQSQPQYVDNTYMTQPSQYVDNTYMNQQQQQMYPTVPQQPPPSYALAVQSPQYSAPVQQQQPQPQFQNNNQNMQSSNQAPQGTPFSKDYKWPRKSIEVVCPQCGATIKTRADSSITVVTIIGAALLLIFTCILVCIPFCIPACKKTMHYCPNCNSVLGVRKELR